MASRKTKSTRSAKATAAKGEKKGSTAHRASKPRATPEQREAATRAAERRAENLPGVEAEQAAQRAAAERDSQPPQPGQSSI